MRFLNLSTCVLLLYSPAFAQEQAARAVPDKQAKELVKAFKKQIKSGKKSLKARLDAVQTLGMHQNNLLVRPLVKVANSDKAKTVRQAAVKAIGNQPSKRARPALLTLLKKTSINKEPAMTAAIVRSISSSSYISKDWDQFEKLFGRVLANQKAVDAQRAILEAAAKHKEVEAVHFLIQHIDEPAPAWVDDPSNPPAAYWEARWKNWQKWQPQVVEALYQITGQRFGSAKEARIWVRKNGKQLKAEARKRSKKSKKKSK